MKKKCYICGKEYIVSIKNTADPYICPACDAQWKREQRKALEKKKMPVDVGQHQRAKK